MIFLHIDDVSLDIITYVSRHVLRHYSHCHFITLFSAIIRRMPLSATLRFFIIATILRDYDTLMPHTFDTPLYAIRVDAIDDDADDDADADDDYVFAIYFVYDADSHALLSADCFLLILLRRHCWASLLLFFFLFFLPFFSAKSVMRYADDAAP